MPSETVTYVVYYMDEPAGVWRRFPAPAFPTREAAEAAFEASVAQAYDERYRAWKAGNWQVVDNDDG